MDNESDIRVYEFGCLMVYLNLEFWQELLNSIDDKDLYNSENQRYGKEDSPHMTILYGIHSDVKDESVLTLFSSFCKEEFDINFGIIDFFDNPEYDVLKITVDSNKMNELNTLAKNLDHTCHFLEYKCHITIAYLKKGQANKYRDLFFNNKNLSVEKIVYSKIDGERIDIPLI